MKFLFCYKDLSELHLMTLLSFINSHLSVNSITQFSQLAVFLLLCLVFKTEISVGTLNTTVSNVPLRLCNCCRLLPVGQRRRRRESSDTQRQRQRLRLLGLGEEWISVATSAHSRQLARQVRAVCQRTHWPAPTHILDGQKYPNSGVRHDAVEWWQHVYGLQCFCLKFYHSNYPKDVKPNGHISNLILIQKMYCRWNLFFNRFGLT